MKGKQRLMDASIAARLCASAAATIKTEALVKADNKADFSGLVAALQIQMASGVRFEFVTLKKLESVSGSLADM